MSRISGRPLLAVLLTLSLTYTQAVGLSAQDTATLTGHVVDATTQAPIAGVRVLLTGSTERGPVLTDATGAFAFGDLPAGSYTLRAERDGYLPTSWPSASGWVRHRNPPIELAPGVHRDDVVLALDRGRVGRRAATLAASASANTDSARALGAAPSSVPPERPKPGAAQLRVRVVGADGTLTGEYAVVMFPVDPARWTPGDPDISAAAPVGTPDPAVVDPATTGGIVGLTVRNPSVRAGEYFVIAVDDIEYASLGDAAVLRQLAQRATRVKVGEAGLIEVPLQRYRLAEIVR